MGHIQIRISDEEKIQIKGILEKSGLTYSSAIKLFFKKTIQQKKIPFDISTSFSVKLPKMKSITPSSKRISSSHEPSPNLSWNPFTKHKIGS
jgi:addiction module RelB/DinJ family antitoxin